MGLAISCGCFRKAVAGVRAMSGDVEEVHSEDSACDSDDGWKHVAWRPQGNSRLPLDAGLSDGPHVDSQLFGPPDIHNQFPNLSVGHSETDGGSSECCICAELLR